jgi:enamine deaminase RidA (YjgF/YER057c/UK114 family)
MENYNKKHAGLKSLFIISLVVMIIDSSCSDQSQKPNVMESTITKSKVEFLNPDSLHKNPAYSQVVVTEGAVKTIYIGGQNAVNETGEIVGKGDMKARQHRF